MIGVRKNIACELRDTAFDKQVEYLHRHSRLTLIARDKDAAYLANTVEQSSVICARARIRAARDRVPLGPRTTISMPSRSRPPRMACTPLARKIRSDDRGHGELRGSEGHRDEVFRGRPQKQAFRHNGIVRNKLVTCFSCDGRQGGDALLLHFWASACPLDGDLFLVFALRARSSNHQPGQTGRTSISIRRLNCRDWAHMQRRAIC